MPISKVSRHQIVVSGEKAELLERFKDKIGHGNVTSKLMSMIAMELDYPSAKDGKRFQKLIPLIALLFIGLSGCMPSTQSQLRYNPYERTWSYAQPDSQLRWNYMERKWEFTK